MFRRIQLMILLLSVVSFLQAEPLTKERLLGLLRKNHPMITKEEAAVDALRQGRESLKGREDWQLTSGLMYGHGEPAMASGVPEKTDMVSLSAGMERTFWKTGGRFSVSYSGAKYDHEVDPLYGIPESYYENEFSVRYVQPLMKNCKGLLDRLEYELADHDIRSRQIEADENIEAFYAGVLATFLDWALVDRQVNILEERVKLSREELERTVRKHQMNLVEYVDVLRAEDVLRAAEQNLLLLRGEWKSLQYELSILAREDSLRESAPSYDLTEAVSLPDEAAVREEIINRSRVIQVLRERMAQLKMVKAGLNEMKKPELSLVTSAALKSADEGMGASLKMDKPDYSVGLQLSIPLGNRVVRSDMLKNELEMLQLERQIEEVELDMVSAAVSIVIRMGELEKVLAMNREHIDSARLKTREEIKLYEQGRGDLSFVIQSRDNEQNARMTYMQNAAAYHKLYLGYLSLTDSINPEEGAE